MSLQYTKGHTCIYQMQQILQQVQNFAGRKTCENRHAIPHVIRKRVLHIITTLLKEMFFQTKTDNCMVVCLISGLLVVSVSKQTERWSLQENVSRGRRKFTCCMYGECCGNYYGNCFVIWLTVECGYWSLYSEIRIVSTKKMTLKCKLKKWRGKAAANDLL